MKNRSVVTVLFLKKARLLSNLLHTNINGMRNVRSLGVCKVNSAQDFSIFLQKWPMRGTNNRKAFGVAGVQIHGAAVRFREERNGWGDHGVRNVRSLARCLWAPCNLLVVLRNSIKPGYRFDLIWVWQWKLLHGGIILVGEITEFETFARSPGAQGSGFRVQGSGFRV
jgi:hypothetical protein